MKQVLNYDALQRTAGIEVKTTSNQPLLKRSYLYDKAGNIITRNTEEGEYTYGYDQLSRLKQVNPPQSAQQKGLPQESYAYDAVHNRVGSSHQAGAWQYNQDNQLVKFGAGVEETSYTYTANGHVRTETKGGTTKTYTYDVADRLVRVTNTVAGTETEIARYAYDPFGRRISKTVNGETTYFIYTGEGLLAELNEGGEIERAYGWELNTLYGTSPLWQAEVTNNQVNTAQFHTLMTDHLGTPQMAVNDQGQITWKAVSESFGKTLPDSQNLIAINLRFPGQYFDEETGTHYNYFRDYNPNAGRYLQQDPIGLEAGINWYGYVEGNPSYWSDPYGLQSNNRGRGGRSGRGRSSNDPIEVNIHIQVERLIEQIRQIQPSYTYSTMSSPGGPIYTRRDMEYLRGELNTLRARAMEEAYQRTIRDYQQQRGGSENVCRPADLRQLHSEATMRGNQSSRDFWSRRTNEEIINSLRPGQRESLRVYPDGTIANGNTRVEILRSRDYDVNSLPREIRYK